MHTGEDMKAIKVIQFAWIAEVAILVSVAIILIFVLPDRVSAYVSMLPLLTAMIVAQGGAAFGGPAIKRAQQVKNDSNMQGQVG